MSRRRTRAGRGARRARVVSAAAPALLAALGALGCGGDGLPVEVRDPDRVLGDSAWTHVMVFEGACPPLGEMVLGTYPDAPTYQQIARADGGFDDIGELPAGPLGFGIVARSDTCQVVGVGCTNADLRDVDRVDIVVGRVYDSSARTACGTQCVEGQCAASGTDTTSANAGPPLSL
ncbi:MAG TPA: hypothetical protein VFS00_17890 [Polyangiaceae bacterium]|nr:hypothetical protein [Polyangiaceae bacterium]